MTEAKKRIKYIKEYLEDGWFWDNPNCKDVDDEVKFLLDQIASLETKLQRAIEQRNAWIKTALRNDFSMRDQIEREVRTSHEIKLADELIKELEN